jgi:hypothetical protein
MLQQVINDGTKSVCIGVDNIEPGKQIIVIRFKRKMLFRAFYSYEDGRWTFPAIMLDSPAMLQHDAQDYSRFAPAMSWCGPEVRKSFLIRYLKGAISDNVEVFACESNKDLLDLMTETINSGDSNV